MVVTNYSERQHGDPDVEVQFDHEGQTVTGFIDARRHNDGVWEAWVWFSHEENGWRATRKGLDPDGSAGRAYDRRRARRPGHISRQRPTRPARPPEPADGPPGDA